MQGIEGAPGRAGVDGIPGRDVSLSADTLACCCAAGHSASTVSLVLRVAPGRKESGESWVTGELW